ncbi:hypothetical protein F9U64_11915 [Gracilibacillus oryzae]|uniref:Uncharacterized protein n=1 Tax=Gracilibacillus oryzae TaxID=1672701 RepID=A0A7C8KYU0_9BACI|nr:hypothetical protein [Gracilibacillus oryzae]KAB8133610.1 hypothetical protein F9U64_11915 [Gracilibacillus oryzae]
MFVIAFSFFGVVKSEADVQYVNNDNYKVSIQTSSDGINFYLGLSLGMTITLDDGYATNHRMSGWLQDACMLPYSTNFGVNEIAYSSVDGTSSYALTDSMEYVSPGCSNADGRSGTLMYNVKYVYNATGDAFFQSNDFIPGFDAITVTINSLPYNTSSLGIKDESKNALDYTDYFSRINPSFEKFTEEINTSKDNKVTRSKHELKINNQKFNISEYKKFKAYKDLFKSLRGEEPYTDEEIKNAFIERKVLLNIAKEKDLSVSVEEAKKYKQKVDQEEAKLNNENVKFTNKLQYNYQKSLNLTDQEYEDLQITKYQEILTIGKLKQNFFENNTDNSDYKKISKKWKTYKDNLVKGATVEGF